MNQSANLFTLFTNPPFLFSLLFGTVSLINFITGLGKTNKSDTDKVIEAYKALHQTNISQQTQIDAQHRELENLKVRSGQEEKLLEDYRLIFQNRNPQTIAKYQKLEATLDKLAEGMQIVLDKLKETATIEEKPL